MPPSRRRRRGADPPKPGLQAVEPERPGAKPLEVEMPDAGAVLANGKPTDQPAAVDAERVEAPAGEVEVPAAEATQPDGEVEAPPEAAPPVSEVEAPAFEAPAFEAPPPAAAPLAVEVDAPAVPGAVADREPEPWLPADWSPPAPDAPAAPAAVDARPARPEHGEAPGIYERLWATGLLNAGAIARRELGALFVSPIGYVVCALLIFPVTIIGYLGQVSANQPVTMNLVFSLVALLAVFFTPLYTMRLLAEERRSGTLELLLTSPVRDWELVVGKWLGGFLFYLATIAFTLVYVVLISLYQQLHTPVTVLGLHLSVPDVDYGAIFTGYVGVALVAAAWVALGLLASSLTSNQIIAAVGGIFILLAFQYLFGALSGFLTPPYSDLLDYVSAANRAQSFNQGQLALRDVIYFVTLTVGALFVATRVVESRKWR